MSNNINRIARLERELDRRTHLSDDEQHSRWAHFSFNELKGVAVSPSDLHGCAHIAEYYQRKLMPTEELCAQIEAGEPPRLARYETWCARLLMVPPGQRVPDFLLAAFETEFEDAWRQRTRPVTTWRPDLRLYAESVRRFITHALGTLPDAARLRHRIAAGELDGPPRYPDRWNFLRNYHHYVSYDMPHFPNVGWNGEVKRLEPIDVLAQNCRSATNRPSSTAGGRMDPRCSSSDVQENRRRRPRPIRSCRTGSVGHEEAHTPCTARRQPMSNSQTETPTDLDSTDEILIDALSRGLSHKRAGELISRSAKTVARRLADADFANAVEQRRRAHASELRSLHENLATQALEVLQDCLTSDNDNIRLAAARALLQQHRINRLDLDVVERLDEIETLALLDKPNID